MGRALSLLSLLLVALWSAPPAQARDPDALRIACASNFYPTLKRLAALFSEAHPAPTLELISGASGQLYQQIRHGAPYHLFLSADAAYPAALHRQDLSDAPRTYALGRLALWDPRALGMDGGRPRTVAIANPATAPYGRAAEAVIGRYRAQQPALRWRTVIAANVSQATQLVDGGNADLGLVALSLVRNRRGEYRPVPEDWHQPLVQQGVVVDTGNRHAEAFMAFLLSERAGRRIRADGYALPGEHNALAR
jgi:molybdate transport system substrate-binding protein